MVLHFEPVVYYILRRQVLHFAAGITFCAVITFCGSTAPTLSVMQRARRIEIKSLKWKTIKDLKSLRSVV